MITRIAKPLFLSAALLSGCCHCCPPPATPPMHGGSCEGMGPGRGGPPHGPGERRFHAPPPEAFAACEGKAERDACSVTLPDRAVMGHCATPPPDAGDTRLFCMPEHGPGTPPPSPNP